MVEALKMDDLTPLGEAEGVLKPLRRAPSSSRACDPSGDQLTHAAFSDRVCECGGHRRSLGFACARHVLDRRVQLTTMLVDHPSGICASQEHV